MRNLWLPLVRVALLLTLVALLLVAHSGQRVGADAPRPAACWLLDSPQAAYVSGGGLALLQRRCSGAAQQLRAQSPSPSPAEDAGPRAAPLSEGTDIRINNPSTDVPPVTTQNETAIEVCDNTALAAWNDSGSAFSGAFTGYGRSTDGGASWTDAGFVPGLTGSDPVLAADRNCRFYFSAITFLNGCVVIGVSRSNDLGANWGPVVNASPGVSCQNFEDKDWIAVDNTAGAHSGNVYACWDDRGEKEIRLLFSRSTDGGQSFSPPIVLDRFFFGFATGCHIAVGPAGEVHAVWTNAENLGVFSRTSANGGLSFGDTALVAATDLIGQFTLCTNNQIRPILNGGIRTFNWPALAVNPLNGHLHVVWNSANSGADVFYARSTDGGLSWTAPVRLNDDATKTDQFQPALAFTKSGVLRAIWYDRRLDPDNNYLIDVYSATSTDDGTTFAPNERITDVSFGVPPLDPNFDPVASACYMGDYIGIAGGQDAHYMVWGDNRNVVDGHPDPDVYFEKRSAAGLTLAVTRFDDPGPDGCTPTDCSLREAVIGSNASPGVDTILLPAGSYVLTRPGSGEDLSATGDMDLLGAVTITGAGAADTTVDGHEIDRVFHVLATASVEISGVTVRGGHTVDSLAAGGADGGAIANSGTLTVNAVTVAGNESAGSGGGISNQGILTITNSAIYDNSAAAGGGGIFNSGSLTVVNSTIARNGSDAGSGGGIANVGSATLRHVTLDNNSATSGGTGGNIGNQPLSRLELLNSIVAAGQGGNCSGEITSLGHNLEDANDCLFAASGDLTSADPLLGPLGDNRGPTPTSALLPNSRAIDAAGGAGCPPADQRGFIRPVDGAAAATASAAAANGPACDIGAYEFGSRPLGDVDCDFDMDAVDALFVLRYAAALQPFASCLALAGDANCDGAKDSVDALAILRRVAHLPAQQQANCPPLGLS